MHQEIMDYWFSPRVQKKCWGKDPLFDQEICDRFLDVYEQAVAGELSHWHITAEGKLAEIIVLDQFPRNMFRDSAAAFAHDELARKCTRAAIESGDDSGLAPSQQAFLYMPLMHSEDIADHELAVQVYSSHPDLAGNLRFELAHKAIIDRFGHYPHRNAVLDRECSDEETAFLQQPGSSF
jgi:uncharacterized protein (DUF924 family)